MTNPVDVMAQVQAAMAEALTKIPDDAEFRAAVITICLDRAKRLTATEETPDLREFWAEKFYQAADKLAAPIRPARHPKTTWQYGGMFRSRDAIVSPLQVRFHALLDLGPFQS